MENEIKEIIDTLSEMQSFHERGSAKWAKIEIAKNIIATAFVVADSIGKGDFSEVVESTLLGSGLNRSNT